VSILCWIFGPSYVRTYHFTHVCRRDGLPRLAHGKHRWWWPQ
jgi:hypothetical protein